MAKTVVQCFKSLKRNTLKRDKLQARIAKLQEKLTLVAEDVARGQTVDFLHEGIPIHRFEYDLRGVEGPAELRSAHIYKNANDKRYWGLTLVTRSATIGHRQEHWVGAGWPSLKICEFMALEWIVHGKMPLESLRRYAP